MNLVLEIRNVWYFKFQQIWERTILLQMKLFFISHASHEMFKDYLKYIILEPPR